MVYSVPPHHKWAKQASSHILTCDSLTTEVGGEAIEKAFFISRMS